MKPARLLLLPLIAGAFALAQDATYDLLWKPKQGQAIKYVVSVDSTVGGAKVSFGAEMQLKVPKVEANGDYTVESTYSHTTLIVDGTNMDIGESAPEKPEVQKFNAKGKLLSEKVKDEEAEADPFSHALSSMMDFHTPDTAVKIGGTWTAEIKGDDKAKTRPVKIVYTAAGLEKSAAASVIRVTFVYTETEGDKPVTANGAFLLDATDGSLHRLDATIANLRFDDKTPVEATKVKVIRS